MCLTLSGCSFFSAGGSLKFLRVLHHNSHCINGSLGIFISSLDTVSVSLVSWTSASLRPSAGMALVSLKPDHRSEVLRWCEAPWVSSVASVSQQTLLGWLQLPWSLAPYVTSASVVTSDVWQALTALRSLSSYCLYHLSDSRAATFAASVAFTSAIMWVSCALLLQFPAAVFATYMHT